MDVHIVTWKYAVMQDVMTQEGLFTAVVALAGASCSKGDGWRGKSASD